MNLTESISTAITTARPLRSLGFFAAVILGFVLAGFSLPAAVFSALPMYPICMAGFTINDIFDQESDRINHPERALARYPALTKSVSVIYSFLFLISISLIVWQDNALTQAIWAFFFLLLSNYSFIKRSLPLLKNVYVACSGCVVLLLIDLSVDGQVSQGIEYFPFAMAIIAREFSGDVEDIAGDVLTLATILGNKAGHAFGIIVYLGALLMLVVQSSTFLDLVFSMVGGGCLATYAVCKFGFRFGEKQLIAVTGLLVTCHAILVLN